MATLSNKYRYPIALNSTFVSLSNHWQMIEEISDEASFRSIDLLFFVSGRKKMMLSAEALRSCCSPLAAEWWRQHPPTSTTVEAERFASSSTCVQVGHHPGRFWILNMAIADSWGTMVALQYSIFSTWSVKMNSQSHDVTIGIQQQFYDRIKLLPRRIMKSR